MTHMLTVVGRHIKIKTPSASAGCIPPAARTRESPTPTAGSTPKENDWVSKFSLKFRAAPASSPSLMARPTKKKTNDTPASFEAKGAAERTNSSHVISEREVSFRYTTTSTYILTRYYVEFAVA